MVLAAYALAPRALSARSYDQASCAYSGLCGLSFLVIVFRMFSNLMRCLLSCRFERLTVSPASPSAEMHSSQLLKKRDSKRFNPPMAKGPYPSQRPFASCPSNPCCLLYCLISSRSAAHDGGTSRSAMAGMVSSSACASDTFQGPRSSCTPLC